MDEQVVQAICQLYAMARAFASASDNEALARIELAVRKEFEECNGIEFVMKQNAHLQQQAAQAHNTRAPHWEQFFNR